LNRNRIRRQGRVLSQAVSIGALAPQVIAMRTARMLAAGARPSARDQREFIRMGAEKVHAAGEAWQSMAMQALAVQQRMGVEMMQAGWQAWVNAWTSPWYTPRWPQPGLTPRQAGDALLSLARAGLAPVQRRVKANARRLRPR